MVRMGLSSSLNAEEDMEVVAEAGSGEDAVGSYRKHRPNLVLMDGRLPKMSGAEAVAAITRDFPEACILMLSTHSGEEEIGVRLKPHHIARGVRLRIADRRPGHADSLLSASGAENVETSIGRDPVQPRTHRRPDLECADVPPGGEERLLDGVFRVLH